MWIKSNWKQLLVASLSAACAIAIHLRPESRDLVLAVGGALGLVGLHLPRIAYGGRDDG